MVSVTGQPNTSGSPSSVPASVLQPNPSASSSDSVNGHLSVIMDTSASPVSTSNRGTSRVTDNRRVGSGSKWLRPLVH